MIRIMKMGKMTREEIFPETPERTGVESAVLEILADVRKNGDEALLRYGRKFDCPDLERLEVRREEIDAAAGAVSPDLMRVLRKAEENIAEFHKNQLRTGFVMTRPDGAVMGQRILPIARVGIYVPGGTAAYPSTVLMNAVPARLAGCGEIVMATPCGRNGEINPAILAAAKLAGVTRVFRMGGAQAVAAMAFGTESVPKVDKIVGPGNAYVAEAKRQVFGRVAIDMVAGPSEILVVADAAANPRHVAADMLSQAEHDKMASAVLVTDSSALAEAVAAEIQAQLERLPRRELAQASIEKNGRILLTENLAAAVEAANELAPEHLELFVTDPFAYLGLVKNAGSVFLGANCPEALGDYLAGPNHTLPTSGTARFSSPLSVDDFVKKSQYTYFPKQALDAVAADVALFAETEGLSAHARSAVIRQEGERR